MADDGDYDDYEADDDNEADDDDEVTVADEDVDVDAAEEEAEEGAEADEDAVDENADEDEYLSDHEHDRDREDDLADFQKMLSMKQKQDFRTVDIVTKYELAAAIGFRAQQLAEGAPPNVEVGSLTDVSAIAVEEFTRGVMPFIFARPLPSKKIGEPKYERRTINELINVHQLE